MSFQEEKNSFVICWQKKIKNNDNLETRKI